MQIIALGWFIALAAAWSLVTALGLAVLGSLYVARSRHNAPFLSSDYVYVAAIKTGALQFITIIACVLVALAYAPSAAYFAAAVGALAVVFIYGQKALHRSMNGRASPWRVGLFGIPISVVSQCITAALAALLLGWSFFETKSNVPPGMLTVLEVLPPGSAPPKGAVRVRIKDRTFRIPNEFLYLKLESGRQDGVWIRFSWPAVDPIASEDVSRFERVQVLLIARRDSPVPVTRSNLEEIITGRHGSPVHLAGYPDVQEYPSQNGTPHYRSRDGAATWADGLPPYFYCLGDAISSGADPARAHEFAECSIELTWPDSFMLNIQFNKRNFRDWRAIHDSAIRLVDSFETSPRANIGTLLKDSQ